MDKEKLKDQLDKARRLGEDWTDAVLRRIADQPWSWMIAFVLFGVLVWCVVKD